MLASESFLTLLFLVMCGFAAGFFPVRHLRWSPTEKLCASVSAPIALLDLVFEATHLTRPPQADDAAGESGKGARVLVNLLAQLALGFAGVLAKIAIAAGSERVWRLAQPLDDPAVASRTGE